MRVVGDVIDAALSVQDLVRERAPACERAGHLEPDVVDALVAAGLMRMCVPRDYGGPEPPARPARFSRGR